MSATDDFARDDDRTTATVVYVLYLLGPLNGLTILIGLIVAYPCRDRAGPVTESHFLFQIRTFWMSIAWAIIGMVLLFWGIPLSFLLIGVPLVIAGGLILGLLGVWFLLRSALGWVYLSRGEPYPRPRSWLI